MPDPALTIRLREIEERKNAALLNAETDGKLNAPTCVFPGYEREVRVIKVPLRDIEFLLRELRWRVEGGKP